MMYHTCTCFVTSPGYKPEHRCLTYSRKAADVRALNYFSYWITLERRPLNFFKPIFGLVGRMMRCVNRPVLGHIIPQSAATEAAVEGSEFGFLTTCSACVSVQEKQQYCKIFSLHDTNLNEAQICVCKHHEAGEVLSDTHLQMILPILCVLFLLERGPQEKRKSNFRASSCHLGLFILQEFHP
ncbi:hypothetical protein R6Z07M_007712 [Ovis aries]